MQVIVQRARRRRSAIWSRDRRPAGSRVAARRIPLPIFNPVLGISICSGLEDHVEAD
jgi:hypothetical protein